MQCPNQNICREGGRLKSKNLASNWGDNTALVAENVIGFVTDNYEQHDDTRNYVMLTKKMHFLS